MYLYKVSVCITSNVFERFIRVPPTKLRCLISLFLCEIRASRKFLAAFHSERSSCSVSAGNETWINVILVLRCTCKLA